MVLLTQTWHPGRVCDREKGVEALQSTGRVLMVVLEDEGWLHFGLLPDYRPKRERHYFPRARNKVRVRPIG